MVFLSVILEHTQSLSARRAWIENSLAWYALPIERLSLSARRAWIENRGRPPRRSLRSVALRKESVDRKS